MAVSSIGISIPVFLTAIMLMYLFSIQLGWLPAYGRGETLNLLGWESGFFTWDGIKHLILPAVSLSSIMLPLFIRLVRSEMLEQLSSEYVKFARAKGLDNNKVCCPTLPASSRMLFASAEISPPGKSVRPTPPGSITSPVKAHSSCCCLCSKILTASGVWPGVANRVN